MQIILTVVRGPHQGSTFTIAEHDCFLVGRGSQAHFRLPHKDPFFSRRHFLVEVNPPRCCISDMGSMNGTFVNGHKVTTAELRDGDTIGGGATEIRVSLHEKLRLPAVEEILSLEQIAASARGTPCAGPAGALADTIGWEPDDVVTVDPDDRALLTPDYQDRIRGREQPFPGYQIVDEVGRGRMGVVYRALRAADGRVVALKTIAPAEKGTTDELHRFLREMGIFKDLSHPRIVGLRDMGTASGRPFFVMDLIAGVDLRKLIKRELALPVGRAVGLVCQLLEALEYAHEKGFVHRDVKPANLIVASRKHGESVTLTDFGLARAYQATRFSGLTVTGDAAGTTPFLAPEQITHFRDVQPAADQYSAAATLYHMLTGSFIYDFPREPAWQINLILGGKPVSILKRRADLPRGLAQAIHRALAALPGERFAGVHEFRACLTEFTDCRG